MRRQSICLTTVAALVLMASSALAQEVESSEEVGVSWTRPEGWVDVEGNDRAIFNIKHEESQSQIEVIATELMSADVADVFFQTFHETLQQSNFSQIGVREQQEIGAHSGKMTDYRFEYAGVVLRVVVFEFTHEATAYLVVGYIKDDEYDTHYDTFEQAVRSINFQG